MSKIVEYVKEGMNREDIFCSTYQMRDFYVQLHDGFFNNLEVMNWLAHIHCLKHIKAGDVVLDLCCGRGLLLPFLKHWRKDIKQYVGVDISEKNIEHAKTRHGMRQIDYTQYYPFPVAFYNVASSYIEHIGVSPVDVIVFLASVEHMQKEEALRTLKACFDVLKPGGKLIISTPNTREPRADGYQCQYRAHLYEWNLEELSDALKAIGFRIEAKYGLLIRKRDLPISMNPEQEMLAEHSEMRKIEEYLPYDIFTCIMAAPYPELAKEVLIVARKEETK